MLFDTEMGEVRWKDDILPRNYDSNIFHFAINCKSLLAPFIYHRIVFFQFPLVDLSLCPAKIGQLLPEVKYSCPVLYLNQIFHAVKFLLSCHFVIGTSKSSQHASRASQGLGHGRIGLEKTSVPQWGGTLWRQGYLGVQVGEWATWELSGLGYFQDCQSLNLIQTDLQTTGCLGYLR